MYRSLLGIVVALASIVYANNAQAQFAGESDYEYTVLYEDSTISFLDYYIDLYYDFELYIESPSITGYWEMVGDPFDTRDEAEFWESMLETNYNTYILAVPSTPTLPRRMDVRRTDIRSRP